MRLIDATELWVQIYKLYNKHRWKERTNIAFRKCLDVIQFFPIVDAEPVRHGRWIDKPMIPVSSSGKYPVVECNKCGTIFCDLINNHRATYHYCPYCGAKMDEVEDEE